jgi:hypothetical protein
LVFISMIEFHFKTTDLVIKINTGGSTTEFHTMEPGG